MEEATIENLLKKRKINEDIIGRFNDNGITIEMIKDLSEDHLKVLSPQIGPRIQLKKVLDEYLTSQTDTSSVFTDDQSNIDSNDDIDNVAVTLFNQRSELPDFDLKTLLTTTPMGKSVLNHYGLNKTLDQKRRAILTDIIVRHLYTRIVNCRVTHEEYDIISAKIVALFPTEKLGTYFVRPVKKADSKTGKPVFARGKLVDKVRNLLFNSGERKRKISCDSVPPATASSTKESNSNTEENLKSQLIWLNHNTEPWDDVIKNWKETYEFRRELKCSSIYEFIEKFKILQDLRSESLGARNTWRHFDPSGSFVHNPFPQADLVDFTYALEFHHWLMQINYDFDKLYPNKSMSIYERWPDFFEKLLSNKNDIEDQCQLYIEMLTQITNDDKRIPLQFMIFGQLVPPKGRLNRKIKYSTIESIEGLLVNVQSSGDVEKKIEDQKEKAKARKQTVQPYIIVVGPYSDWTTLLVIVDTIRYQFDSAYKAFDVLFKLYHTLNASYPPASAHLYLIIQRKVYGIETEYDLIPPYIHEIMSL